VQLCESLELGHLVYTGTLSAWDQRTVALAVERRPVLSRYLVRGDERALPYSGKPAGGLACGLPHSN